VIDEEIQNQLQMDMSLGRVKEGSWKYWLLAATALALPVKNALFELAPNGPDAWAVGEDAEAVKAPVTPDVSRNSSPGLNV
jgi:NOL1/NOP2/fmu family ribosome biogenesis protein